MIGSANAGVDEGLVMGVTTGVNTARAMMGHLQRVRVLLGNDLVLWWEMVGGKMGAKRLTGTECKRGCARGFDYRRGYAGGVI